MIVGNEWYVLSLRDSCIKLTVIYHDNIYKVQFRPGLVSSLFPARTYQSSHENLNAVGGGLQCNAVSPETVYHEDRGSPSPSGASLKMSCGHVTFHSSSLSLGLSWNLFYLPDETKWDDLQKNVWQVSPTICENTMDKMLSDAMMGDLQRGK